MKYEMGLLYVIVVSVFQLLNDCNEYRCELVGFIFGEDQLDRDCACKSCLLNSYIVTALALTQHSAQGISSSNRIRGLEGSIDFGEVNITQPEMIASNQPTDQPTAVANIHLPDI